MKILEIRPEQVICKEDNGSISTRPNSPYYSLRYFKFNNKRIAYTFSDTSYCMETFDQRIFNCWHNGRRIQLRQDLSEQLASSIKHHEQYGNIREYAELFDTAFGEIPFWDILAMYLRNINGVIRQKDGFLIYDEFKIDFKGNAWIRPQGEDPLKRERDDWNSLCIVMQGKSHAYNTEKGGFLPDENGNMVEVNALTMTIIAKIVFLLNPNMKDTAFTNQLSKNLLFKLIAISGGEC
jgi:hypothetical protein